MANNLGNSRNAGQISDVYHDAITNNNLLVRKLFQTYSLFPQNLISETHVNENEVTADKVIVENLSAAMAAKIKTIPQTQGIFQISLAALTDGHYLGQFASVAGAADAFRLSVPFEVSRVYIDVYAVGVNAAGGDINITDLNDDGVGFTGTAGSAVTIPAVTGDIVQGTLSYVFDTAVAAGTGLYVKMSNASAAAPSLLFLSVRLE